MLGLPGRELGGGGGGESKKDKVEVLTVYNKREDEAEFERTREMGDGVAGHDVETIGRGITVYKRLWMGFIGGGDKTLLEKVRLM